jgi:uncharacterized protein
MLTSLEEISAILKNNKRIAVVGMSRLLHRAGYYVPRYMLDNGYTIYPVNPKYDEILGLKCYKTLDEIPEEIDIVNIFRRSDQVVPIVEQAIKIKTKVIWMQLGVINKEAFQLASAAGLKVIMDRCIKVDHANIFA